MYEILGMYKIAGNLILFLCRLCASAIDDLSGLVHFVIPDVNE